MQIRNNQCCAWARSMNDRSWTRSYFGQTWTERTVFYLMKVTVNAFILAFVNGAFSQFNFVQDSARFPSSLPGKNRLKQTVKSLMCSGKTPNLAVVYKKDAGREVSTRNFSILDRNSCIPNMQWMARYQSVFVWHYQTNTDEFVLTGHNTVNTSHHRVAPLHASSMC